MPGEESLYKLIGTVLDTAAKTRRNEGTSVDGLGYGRGSNCSNDGLEGELVEFNRLDGGRIQILCTLAFDFVLTRLVSIAVKSSTIFGYQVLPLAVPGRRPESSGATTCMRGSPSRLSERTTELQVVLISSGS